MEYLTIADFLSYTSLTRIQKSRVVEKANSLLEKGFNKSASIKKAVSSLLIEDPDEEQRISYEVIYEPDSPDAHGQWMTKETLVKAQRDYLIAQASGAVKENLFHLGETDGWILLDHWIHPELDVTVNGTGEIIKAGSWIAKVKYSPELWELKKSGIVGGLSVQCTGMLDEETAELSDLDFRLQLEDEEEKELNE